MSPLLLAVALATTPTIDQEQTPFGMASDLDGLTVRTSFVVSAPPYTLNGTTVFGTGDRDDDTERTVYLPAVADIEAGDT